MFGIVSWIKLQYLAVMQERLIFKPAHDIVEPMLTPADYGLALVQESEIFTVDDTRLCVWHQPPSDPSLPYLFFMQGNTGHIADVGAPLPGEVFERDYRIHFIRAATKRGYGFVYYCPRGFGKSSRSPISEEGMKNDVEAVLTHIVEELEIAPNNLTIVGESLGACSALMAAGYLHDKKLNYNKVVLIAPFYSIVEKIRELHPDIPLHAALKKIRHHLDNGHYLEKVNPQLPITIITPEADETTAPWHSGLLLQKAHKLGIDAQQYLLKDAGHITWRASDILDILKD